MDKGLSLGMVMPRLASISVFCFFVGGSRGDFGLVAFGTSGFEA